MMKIGQEFLPRSDRESEYYRRAHDLLTEAVEHGTPEEAQAAWEGYEHALEEMPLQYKGEGELLQEEKELILETERLRREAQMRGISLAPSDFLKKWAAVLSAEAADTGNPEDPKNENPLTKEEEGALTESVEAEMEAEAEELTRESLKKKES